MRLLKYKLNVNRNDFLGLLYLTSNVAGLQFIFVFTPEYFSPSRYALESFEDISSEGHQAFATDGCEIQLGGSPSSSPLNDSKCDME